MTRIIWLCLALVSVQQAVSQEIVTSRKLVIAGGGSLPGSVYEKFVELAGEQSSLVVIPTASSLEPDEESLIKLWKQRGFESVQILHTRDRKVANDTAFAKPIDDATAVWLGGGSQSKIAEAYCETEVERALFRLLERGGVIGGTSAGAAIQSGKMIASGRTEPVLKSGLGFLSECIIDQHFLARDRLRRSVAAVKSQPEKLGLGIDEGTAVVVIDDQAEVIGRSYVIRIESRESGLDLRSYGAGEQIPLTRDSPDSGRSR